MAKYIDCEVGGRFYKDVEFKNVGFSFNEIKLSLWDKITLPFYRCRRLFKDWFYECKYAFDRVILKIFL